VAKGHPGMLKTVRIPTSELDIGMFVSDLDRPWLGTPFITQGFMVKSAQDLARVRHYCEYVYIDRRRSRMTLGQKNQQPLPQPDRDEAGKWKERKRVPIQQIFEGRPIQLYQDSARWEEEYPRAQQVLDTLRVDIDSIFDDVVEGDKLNVIKLRKSVDPIVDSIGRNPDACLWVCRLKQHDQYTYKHSLGAAIWAVSLGRQLGLPRHDLRSLSMGCMLMDIGKLRIDQSLLRTERDLTDAETAELASHVQHGLDILEECGILNQDVIDMVAYHHERYDGSGYPLGLGRDKIPPFARIAGIVDTYDAITSDRDYAQPISPSEAIKLLYKSRDVDFQAELVEAFIQAIGLYPAGTLVELSSGEVAVVVAEYRTRRLRPKVMVLLDRHKKRLPKWKVVDLHALENDDTQPTLVINRSLEPAAYGIDLSEIPFQDIVA
jgi:HD-GYP domain-containing protein (c-di-GMP phosphodiesterase class II)